MTKFAFVFPGQGSQRVGMLSTMAVVWPDIKEAFQEEANALDCDLWDLSQHGPPEELNKTWLAQPVLLTASVALWRIWQQQGGKTPTLLAGHSLGEYSALVCAGVIKFSDAIHLVKLRGKLMQEAVPEGEGNMLAIIGLDEEFIIDACAEYSKEQTVSPASFNAPGQVVISGHKEAVERVRIACKSAGAKHTLLLPISVPSHCALMKSAADKLAVALRKITFCTPTIPVVNNVDVRCETSPEAIRSALVRQLYNPVQWVKTIEFIVSKGVRCSYEVGPGKVLTNLTKKIGNILQTSTINEPDTMSAALLKHKKENHETERENYFSYWS